MRVFKTRLFHQWAAKERLTDSTLILALEEIVQGLVEANLGGHVYKKRVRLPGRGKKGGARTLLAYKTTEKTFFIFGFAKNERDNLDNKQLQAVKELAAELLGYTDSQLKQALEAGELKEIKEEVKEI